jgi:hypothetical protein
MNADEEGPDTVLATLHCYVVMGYMENYRHFLKSTSDFRDHNIKKPVGVYKFILPV